MKKLGKLRPMHFICIRVYYCVISIYGHELHEAREIGIIEIRFWIPIPHNWLCLFFFLFVWNLFLQNRCYVYYFFMVTNFTRNYRSESYYTGMPTIYLHRRWDNRIFTTKSCKIQLNNIDIVLLKNYDDKLGNIIPRWTVIQLI